MRRVGLSMMIIITSGIVILWLAGLRAPTQIDTSQTWATCRSLVSMGDDVARFYNISDKSDIDAIRRVNTLDDLWRVLHKTYFIVGPLVPLPVEQHYLFDAWHRPYVLDITADDKQTVIRILSAGHGNDLYVEIAYNGIDICETFSWQPLGDRTHSFVRNQTNLEKPPDD